MHALHRRYPLVALAVATTLPLQAARAQDADDAALQEIVVTAQKRSENLQDTPVAVAALTGEALEQLNLVNVASIATQSPSLAYSEAGGEAQIYVRGIGSNIFSIGVDQSVGSRASMAPLSRSSPPSRVSPALAMTLPNGSAMSSAAGLPSNQ